MWYNWLLSGMKCAKRDLHGAGTYWCVCAVGVHVCEWGFVRRPWVGSRAECIVLESAAGGSAVADLMCTTLVAVLTRMLPRSSTHTHLQMASSWREHAPGLYLHALVLKQLKKQLNSCYFPPLIRNLSNLFLCYFVFLLHRICRLRLEIHKMQMQRPVAPSILLVFNVVVFQFFLQHILLIREMHSSALEKEEQDLD